MASPELILGIVGTFTGVLSLAITWLYNRKAIKQTDEALKQTDKTIELSNKALEQVDRNLKTQLLYEDKKRALIALRKLIDETKFRDVRDKLQMLLDSPEGAFIPQEVIGGVYDDIDKVEKFDEKNNPEPKPEEPPEPDDYDPDEGKDEYQKYDEAFDKEVASFQRSVKHRIDNSLKKT